MLATGGSTTVGMQATGSAINQGNTATSSLGTLVVLTADKSVVASPAAATIASASTGAAATIRHIATSCSLYVSTVATQSDIVVNLRDGASGAGTVLWSCRITCTASSACQCASPQLSLLGTANTAMTCETATAPAASNIATTTLTYHDAQ
jgi:hypothetical protein